LSKIGETPGAFHHVVARGINRQRIFLDDPEKLNFIDRLSALLKDSGIKCSAWVVLDNDFHLLL
jgi:putative transposase